MKTKKLNISISAITFAIAFGSAIPAMALKPTGIHSSELLIDCHAEQVITAVTGIRKSTGFTDRAGNLHPAQGYATLLTKVQNLSNGCETLKTKLGIDLQKLDLTIHFSTASTNASDVEKEASQKIGQVKPIHVKQNFSYQDEKGNLPFFPLLHSESVTMAGKTIPVDTASAYGIYLDEEDKVQLTEMIFDYLEQNGIDKGLGSMLIHPLTASSPSFDSNFAAYLQKLLKLFQKLEENHQMPTTGIDLDFELSALAAGVNALTYKTPQLYHLNLIGLLAQHPSMLSTNYVDPNFSFPNLSSSQLDELIDAVEKSLAEGTMHPNVKAAYQKKLEMMSNASYYSGSVELKQLTSKYAQQKAKNLLKTYY